MATSYPFAHFADLAEGKASLKDWGELSPAERADLCAWLVDRGVSVATIRSEVSLPDYTASHLIKVGRQLTVELKHWLHEGRLSFGQARALSRLPAERQEAAARTAVQRGLTVRSVEAIARGTPLDQLNASDRQHYRRLSERVSEYIGYPVAIEPKGSSQRGTITLTYHNLTGFEALMDRLRVPLDELF